MEIVLPLGSADAIFGGIEATTGNASAVRRLHIPFSNMTRMVRSILTQSLSRVRQKDCASRVH